MSASPCMSASVTNCFGRIFIGFLVLALSGCAPRAAPSNIIATDSPFEPSSFYHGLHTVRNTLDSLASTVDSHQIPIGYFIEGMEIAFPPMFCTTNLFTQCIGVPSERCQELIGIAIQQCLKSQRPIMPEFVGSTEQAIRIGSALGACTGDLYGMYYAELFAEISNECQEQMRKLVSEALDAETGY